MNLPCEVVMDLIPLCRDGVGSAESCRLVREHITECPSCRAEYGEAADVVAPKLPSPNEQRLLSKLRGTVLRWQALALIGGAVLGVSMTFSSNVFYNFLLMPIVGALSYLVFRMRFHIVVALVFALSLISNTIYGVIEGGLRLNTLRVVLTGWIFYSVIYAILVLIGWCIAWLLHYALGGSKEAVK